ncbi:flavin reductase family protein [Rhizobiaceae bacterium BDR2-2]|uniref:Flavin reductase family protein n=1 Tax=Ectorhizobium quercum TaxID=2965071 RepID=A0AAE3N1Y0_9HYPH|nr:flavin reductase family protein [Ectorhizobium quercum]MCX8997785.1 flavin reductase family protein [Ectorhizobium quercum]
MEPMPLSEVYRHIEPGPVVLMTTRYRGRPNVMTMSWHMMMEFTPPTIACLVSSGDYSFKGLKRSRECVIAIPGAEMARTTVGIGNCTGADEDKFDRFGLTAIAASAVSPPLIGECFVNIECKVVDTTLVNRYNLFVLEAVAAWRTEDADDRKTIHHRGYGRFAVDGEIVKLPSAMP